MKITRIEGATLGGCRPRPVGCNARLGSHGGLISVSVVRVTTDAGPSGFGWSQCDRVRAAQIVGRTLDDDLRVSIPKDLRIVEYPMLDLIGKVHGKSVAELISNGGDPKRPVKCYDTTLYFDDLHISDTTEAAEFIASEALEGVERGHRSFKIKVGRGAMHMPVMEGVRRDIAVIQGVHSAVSGAVGPHACIMIDANNGYNLNIAKMVLGETSSCGVYWIEEAFHEDPRLYEELKNWMSQRDIKTFIADGEGDAAPHLLEYAKANLIDVVQYDIHRPGFSFWCELGPSLDSWGVHSAPHHFGGYLGNFTSCHLASCIQRFASVEWDEASVEGLESTAYVVHEGTVTVPDMPGFGIELDEKVFCEAVKKTGFTATL